MDIALAVVITVVLIALGAVLSIGNERQRKAIEGLRKEHQNWAEQDIRLKREKLSRSVVVENPLVWLNEMAQKHTGLPLELTGTDILTDQDVPAIVSKAKTGTKYLFTPMPREEFLKAVTVSKKNAGQLARYLPSGLLGDKPAKAPYWEMTISNSEIFFDLEAAQVWRAITGQVRAVDRLFMYELP